MLNMKSLADRGWTLSDFGVGLIFLIGLALSGYGGYTHFTTAAKLNNTHCDGCAPWHPLFVLTPLIVGASLVFLGGYFLFRR